MNIDKIDLDGKGDLQQRIMDVLLTQGGRNAESEEDVEKVRILSNVINVNEIKQIF